VISIDKEKLNAYIMAMYIFQFGFLQPLASIINYPNTNRRIFSVIIIFNVN
jgi:hypothetical protein